MNESPISSDQDDSPCSSYFDGSEDVHHANCASDYEYDSYQDDSSCLSYSDASEDAHLAFLAFESDIYLNPNTWVLDTGFLVNFWLETAELVSFTAQDYWLLDWLAVQVHVLVQHWSVTGFLVNFWLETAELVSFTVQDYWLLDWLAVQVHVLVQHWSVTGERPSSALTNTSRVLRSHALTSGRVLEHEHIESASIYTDTYYPSTLGSGPLAGTQGSATQDPHIAASDSSSDFHVMEGYPMQQHPESSSQDMHALGQQPRISMFSCLKKTLSRATRSEHATNEINEGGEEVDSPFTSQIDPVLSESTHVSTPTTTPIGLSKLTPSETLLPDGRSLAEVQEVERYILAAREKEIESLRKAEQRRATLAKAPMTSANPLQSPELTTLKSTSMGHYSHQTVHSFRGRNLHQEGGHVNPCRLTHLSRLTHSGQFINWVG
ncbi:hypothetical protein L7F22_008890 [Adiantum nelumboides]|nr:hypothetical protein [Adiantum nelumboides]